jgi:glutamate/aspartate transport system substrate-binding protein
MKKNLTALAAALIATGLIALPAVAQTLKKVADSNTITVAHREASVPFSYLVDGQPVGFAVELTAAIVDDLRQALKRPALAVRSVPVTGANRIPLLLDGSIDLECGSTTNTAARGKDVSFAISHFYTGTRLLVRSDSGIRNYADLTGKTVASVAGSTNEKVLRQTSDERRLGVQVVLGKDYAEGLALLERGDAVALALDDVLLFGLRANSANPAALDVVGDTLQVEPYGCMLRKGDPEFKALVDGTISRLMASGEFARLYAKWFMAGIPPRGAVLNMPMSEALRNNLRQRSDQPAM